MLGVRFVFVQNWTGQGPAELRVDSKLVECSSTALQKFTLRLYKGFALSCVHCISHSGLPELLVSTSAFAILHLYEHGCTYVLLWWPSGSCLVVVTDHPITGWYGVFSRCAAIGEQNSSGKRNT